MGFLSATLTAPTFRRRYTQRPINLDARKYVAVLEDEAAAADIDSRVSELALQKGFSAALSYLTKWSICRHGGQQSALL
jgi:hypothetical protein